VLALVRELEPVMEQVQVPALVRELEQVQVQVRE
jgi:hypothetical protein